MHFGVYIPYLAGLKTAAIAAAGDVPVEAVLAWYTAHDIAGSRGAPRCGQDERPGVLPRGEGEAARQNFAVRLREHGHREA